MKVLCLINGLGTGGAERSLLEFLPVAARAGIAVYVVCRKRRREGVQEQVEALGTEVRFLPNGSLLQTAWALRRMLHDDSPDLVHTTIFEANLIGALGAAGTGIPVLTSLVNTAYDPIRFQDPHIRPWKLRAARGIDGVILRNLVQSFHAITPAVKRSAVEQLGLRPGRITVVERGRDPVRLGEPGLERRRAVRRRLGIRDDTTVLINIGRQEYQKGQVVLLRALASPALPREGLLTLFAGREGHASAALASEVRSLGLGESVRFLGHREDVPDLLAASDLFVFPSLYEGLGGAVVEAMALGLPVVGTRIPALEDVTEEGRSAVLVPPADPLALAGALASLMRDPDRRLALGARGRKLFLERFTMERAASRMIDLYREASRLVPPTASRPAEPKRSTRFSETGTT